MATKTRLIPKADAGTTRGKPLSGARQAPVHDDDEELPGRNDREAHLESLEKGLRCLALFSGDQPALTIQDAARLLNITRPAARRILLTLARLGYVNQLERDFTIAPKVLELGFTFFSAQGLRGAAIPYMEMVAARTGETCALGVLDGEDIVFLHRSEARKTMRLDLTVGSRLPAYAHSMGRLLLAALPDQQLESYLKTVELVAFTRFTITDRRQLRAEIERVRKQGWSFSNGELMDGVAGISRPILGANGKVVAGINVSMILGSRDAREAIDQMLPSLTEASEAISRIQQAIR